MITRATLSLGLVWLLMPHHPDLGLTAPQGTLCAADPVCGASQQNRDAIIQRLRAVRSEIQRQKQGRDGMTFGVVVEPGESQQKADSPPFSHRRARRVAANVPGEAR